MGIFNDQTEQISALWEKIYEACENNPQLSEPHLTGITYKDVGSAISTLVIWLETIEEKPRETSAYKLCKYLLIGLLANIVSNLNNIVSGQYGAFKPLSQNINQALSALFPLTYLSDKAKKKMYAESLSATFAERAGELDEAISALHDKLEILESIDEKYAEAEASAAEISNRSTSSSGILTNLQQISTNAQQALSNVNEMSTQAAAAKGEIYALKDASSTLKSELDAHEKSLNALIEKTAETQDMVEKLLPGATATGLAAASETRAGEVGKGKGLWLFGFIITLIGLSAAIILSFTDIFPLGDNFYLNFTKRVSIAAPLIWLAWFCARNYGHKSRLQEVYAFKAVASRTFEGYKKQFIEIEEDNPPSEGEPSLVKALSLIFMQIFAKDPMSVYERKKDDETPMDSAVSGGVAAFIKKILPFGQD